MGGVLLRPSGTCTCKYKVSFAKGMWRCLLAPCFPVSFPDILICDCMTSLAKPLADLPAASCYLFSHHPQTRVEVDLFRDNGDTCPRWVHTWLVPCIIAL